MDESRPTEHEPDERSESESDAEDRRAILSRRAKLLSIALAGVAIAAVAPSDNPVCAQHVPAGAHARPRPRDAGAYGHRDASAALGDATLDPGASDDELPNLDALPEEQIDATVIVHTRPQVCLSNVRRDEPAQGCGCRRATPSESSS